MGARRGVVLGWLTEADRPVSVADVAQGTGLHVNTARFHLDALVEQGRAVREPEPAQAPGRPRILYTATVAPTGARSFGLLGQMLAGIVGDLDADGDAARAAGQRWGRSLAASGGSTAGSTAAFDALLERVGFSHGWAGDDSTGAAPRLEIGHCPFLEVARAHPGVVCRMHQGLIEGAIEGLDADLRLTGLVPFAEERDGAPVCVAAMRREQSEVRPR